MKRKDITNEKTAIEVLRGCSDIVIDTKNNVQYWTIGMKVTPKLIKAGAILDAIIVGEKRVWSTVHMHPDTCACRDCSDKTSQRVSYVRKQHPRKVGKTA